MRLPLFPLNTVLFPGMPINLHIFEERYKVMVQECIDNDTPFGVVLIEEGIQALGPLARPHMVGTAAYIQQVQRLPLGRMNIVAMGQDRFRIQELYKDRPYLSGEVDIVPIEDDNPRHLIEGSKRLRPLVKKYLGSLEDAGQLQGNDIPELPSDPQSLAYFAAVILQTESESKQSLLENDQTSQLLQNLVDLYRREVTLLDVMLSPPPDLLKGRSPFSVN